ncbi:MAG TPA: ATP-binding protein, partial [Bryobacteraceae bacterium]|nr:ATP-binding protein [Bryobacteraceae bacterium]
MNRKLLVRITIPSVIVGLILFTACLLSIRYIRVLQNNMADILIENVRSQQAVQELEIEIRQLRFQTFAYLLKPQQDRLKRIELAQTNFEAALERVRKTALGEEEKALLHQIEVTYQQYTKEQDQLIEEAHGRPLPEAYKIADTHPVRLVVTPCQDLVRVNERKISQSVEESRSVSQEAYLAMVFMGVAGPIGGIVVGFGVTRGLRRSIYRLSVRVQDLAQHLEQDVGTVSVVADGDLEALEAQMQFIVQKVEEAARRLQEQQRELLRTEQLAQVGQLAAGVAHEIRNPLTGIKLLVEAALRPQSPRPINLEDTRVIHREVKKLEQTVQQFLNFARLPAPQIAPCDLRDVVRESWEAVQAKARQQHVEPTFRMPDQPVVVFADAGQLNTVLVNLFLNALDVIGTDGKVEIYLSAADGDMVRLRVCDSGPGIAPEIQDKLFRPFATNKPYGTGLGLFLSGRILDEHGGAISAMNRP